jgi:hypothetical protein
MSEQLSDVSDTQKNLQKEYTLPTLLLTFLSHMLLVSSNKIYSLKLIGGGGGTSVSGLCPVIFLFMS